ncbi:membrane protein insertion efficiency factor YidD [Gracilibacillus sp. YIM 98692]|uniref:membrane protein insertion efficiency factor YidD n=1 Tax=Gracilibacillus sp. YIM 98692 TaxID=2663532 RepID=UPI0013D39D91|nr:membrane protein insertion efficiency factor YidD [Gracilibacillus sp. YIM 98692]
MQYLFIGIIRFYQKFISPMFLPSCRFQPTCSQYSLECFRSFNVFRAFYYTIKRLSKCHPFHSGGFDPVPEPKNQNRKFLR